MHDDLPNKQRTDSQGFLGKVKSLLESTQRKLSMLVQERFFVDIVALFLYSGQRKGSSKVVPLVNPESKSRGPRGSWSLHRTSMTMSFL